MMDFGHWFQRQGRPAPASAPAPAAPPALADDDLPEGVDLMKDGTLRADCCVCERRCEIEREWIERSEKRGEPYRHYCGGSPRCCP